MKNKIIEIEWLDSVGVTPSWGYTNELLPLPPIKCISVGYIVKDKKKYITLVQSISNEQILGRLTIPKCSIIKVRKI